MSQITRCPRCATAFKVVADQLRISQGWVRCGRCQEVFDAPAHMLPAVAAPAATPPPAATAVPTASVAPSPEPVTGAHPPPEPRTAPADSGFGAPWAAAPQQPTPWLPPLAPEEIAALKSGPQSDRDDCPTTILESWPSGQSQAEPQPGFVRAAHRQAFWRKPAVRAVLLLLLWLAVLGLALQIVVQERDRIAALDARARPWLLALCQPLQCALAPQRQIADVVIDNASFNKVRGDSYQLALTMRNRAAIPLAMPAIELTLTDTQDEPVLRRVLLPAELTAPAELAAHGEWSTALSVIVTTGGARVAGYRLLAFYP